MIVGIVLILTSIILMCTIYIRIYIEERAYNHGKCYADEFGRKADLLKMNIPIYGALIVVGVIIVSLTLILTATA